MQYASLLTPTSRRAMSWRILLAAAVAIGLAPPASHAATLLLGPSPYRSAADSPFPIDGSNPKFHLEDFEDGALNAPGLIPSSYIASQGTIRSATAGVHSVDGDDGAIDGQGRAGHALTPSSRISDLVDPARFQASLYFSFDAAVLGFLPNSFGFVWTHQLPNSRVEITLHDSDDAVIASTVIHGAGDPAAMPSEDDRFIGIVSSVGFAAVNITHHTTGSASDFQIDHLQYGLTIPEPASLLPAAWLAATGALTHRRRQSRPPT